MQQDHRAISFADYDLRADEILEEYERILSERGYVHGVDVPATFDHERFLSRFGKFYPGPSGKLIDDIMPEPGMDDVYYGSNRRALLPHTEGYEFDGLPPRYLALWCVTPPSGSGGETTLFDAAPLVNGLTDSQRTLLERTVFTWVSSAGLRKNGLGQESRHCILSEVDDTQLLRFSLNNIVLPEGCLEVEEFLENVRASFERNHITVNYQTGDLLHWDNWRVLHSRNEFQDPKRHLKRIQIRHWSDTRSSGTVRSRT